MAIDYSNLLSPEQKQELLTQRIQQFAAEAYQHQLNKQIAESINDADGAANADAALATLETAITVYQAELEV
jgi:predicted transcriptional regulator